MKKQLFILLTFVTTFVLNGQSNLVYNQTLYLNISENSVTVPENKTWKIVSSNGAFFRIDGAKFDMYHEDSGAVRNMPTWVPSGKTIDAGTQGGVFLSILEFNIVPISSTPNNSTATNSFGNLIPTSNSNSSIPSIFDSPKVFTKGGVWVVPPGVTNIYVEIWGKGGNGGNSVGNTQPSNSWAGGGGGGSYAYGLFIVSEGTVLSVIFDETSVALSNLISAGNGTTGGDVTNWNGIITSGNDGIGGTSTAEFNISGENGVNGRGGNCINGGDGGRRADGNAWGGDDGEFPGGGGGGARMYGSNYRTGGDGGGGQIKIYF